MILVLVLLTISSPKDSPKVSMHLYSLLGPIRHRGMSARRYFLRALLIPVNSDDYWKLYETYTGNLKRIAEIQDALDTTKKDLSDAQTQSQFP